MNKLLLASLLLPIFAISSAHAQMFGGGDRQINELRQEMTARMEASSRAQFELANQNELLRVEIANLRGQIEVLVHEMETLRQRQRDFYVDLDGRLQRMEEHGGAAVATDPAAESEAYEAALALLKEGKHAESLAAFKAFISAHPRSNFLPGANFWAGNAALQTKEIVSARSFFETVIKTWPEDNIAPDAMLGLANSQQLMGETRAAQDTLRQIASRYPESSAAQVARQRMGPS